MLKIDLVKNAMLAVQRYPWEQGVCAQALWELGDDVQYAVDLERYYYPNPKNSNDYRDVPDDFIIDICKAFVKHAKYSK